VNVNRRALLQGVLAAGLAPAAGASAAQSGFEVTPWPKGTPMPALQSLDLSGRPWKLADLRGRAVLLNFWATWCAPCRAEMPTLQQLADLYANELAVVAINFKQSASVAAKFAKSTGLNLPVVLDPDGSNARALGVSVFPTTFLIAADGMPRQRVRGELDWSGREAERLVSGLLAR
jgi:thiol-disulfide isomerase/thioredoxin